MPQFKKTIIAKISVVIFFLFIIFGIRDLPYYGANWDDPVHFGRGQAILYYILTGKTNYKDFNWSRRSYYQSNGYTYDFFEEKFAEGKIPIIGAGHPPLSDVLASISNLIFYQKLHLLGDIESYHLYGVLVSAIGVAAIFYVTSSFYGIFAGSIATLAIAFYPLFLGESRFNIKDIPEATFFALTILSFYRGITTIKWRWIIVSALCFALGFGTKFNIIFLPLIITPWFLFVSTIQIKKEGIKKFFNTRKSLIFALSIFPLIVLALFFLTWPLLWKDPIGRFLYNFRYYKLVGIDGEVGSRFFIGGFNLYALLWISITTPLITLFLSFIGIIYAVVRSKEKSAFPLLLLLWFFIPIIRVSLPHAAIYGGVRQIMEYIPAMAILAGIGANFFVERYQTYVHKKHMKNYSWLLSGIIFLSFLPITLKLISLHPNESVYFNPIIGGLKGAKERNIPGWGNSLGSTYRQGVKWLNEHAEPNARLATVYELRSNIAVTDLRIDIDFGNHHRSGSLKRGEYLIGVTHDNSYESSYHRQYLERFLVPVYQLTIDDVPLIKIWKNDMNHVRPEYMQEKIMPVFSVVVKEKQLMIDLEKPMPVTRLDISYSIGDDCTLPKRGSIDYARIDGFWKRAGDLKSILYVNALVVHPRDGLLQYYFAGNPARYIRITVDDKESCLVTGPVQAEVAVVMQ